LVGSYVRPSRHAYAEPLRCRARALVVAQSPGNGGGCCVTGDPSGWVRDPGYGAELHRVRSRSGVVDGAESAGLGAGGSPGVVCDLGGGGHGSRGVLCRLSARRAGGVRRTSRPASPIRAIGRVKHAQIHRVDGVEHEPREVILRQPLAHVRWHQERLLAITRDEPLRHPRIVFKPPGQHLDSLREDLP
jgi:hypothetical protein